MTFTIICVKVDTSYQKKYDNRRLDRILGQQYREDPSAVGITFAEYKQQYQESIKLRQLKTRYSPFEPMPKETVTDFKKRLRSVTIDVPIETYEEFQQRFERAFNQVK